MRVVLSTPARRDLIKIADYISADAPLRAESFILELRQRCLSLGENPMSGRLRNDLQSGVRSVPHGNYIIFYIITDRVRILRIYHSARRVKAKTLR